VQLGRLIDQRYLEFANRETDLTEVTTEQLKMLLWRHHDLSYLLLDTQVEALSYLEKSTSLVRMALCSRRWGKTYAAAIWIIQLALSKPKSILRYLGPTKKHLRQFAKPTLEKILSDAPVGISGRFDGYDDVYIFPNGSKIFFGSCETESDINKNVGTDCDGAVIEEAGIIRSELLSHAIKSAIIPQFATKPDGRVLVIATLPRTPAHYLVQELLPRLDAANALVIQTIDDAKHVSEEMKLKMIEEQGGINSSDTQRELYCKIVTDESTAVLPEFDAVAQRDIVVETATSTRYDRYIAADFGYNDMAFVVFGYYDFDRVKIVIEDELVFQYKSSVHIAINVIAKELDLWHGYAGLSEQFLKLAFKEALEEIEKYRHIYDRERGLVRRFVDTPPLTRADMVDAVGCIFAGAQTADRDAQIHRLRRIILERRLEINPRCRNLVRHLSYAVWAASRKSFERDAGFGHYDGVGAMQVMTHHVDYRSMPNNSLFPPALDMANFNIPTVMTKNSQFRRT